MHFGISTHLYHEQPLGLAQLQEVAEFGFREVELFATIGHVDYHDERALDQLATWLDEAGLRLHSVHAPIVERVVNGQWGPPLSTAAAAEQTRARAVREARAAAAIAKTDPVLLPGHAPRDPRRLPANGRRQQHRRCPSKRRGDRRGGVACSA